MAKQSSNGAKLAITAIITTVLIGSAAAAGSYFWAGNTSFAAKVNGEVISSQEYLSIVEKAKKQAAGQMGNDFNSEYGRTQLIQMKKNIMDSLVDMTLLKQEAKKMGLSVTPEEREAQFKEFLKGRYQGNEEALDEDLKQNKITREEFDKQLDDQLLLQQLYQKIIADVTVSEEDSKKFYEENKERFSAPEQISAKHILIKAEEGDKAAVEKARVKAADLLKQIKAGASFEELAKKHSEDEGSGANGGDLGKFGKGSMVKPFEDAVWNLKAGELVQEPVQSRFGWHIILRGETTPAEVRDYEAVKPAIEGQLLNTKKREHFEEWMKAQKEQAKIKLNEDLLSVPEVTTKPGEENAETSEAPSKNDPEVKMEQPAESQEQSSSESGH